MYKFFISVLILIILTYVGVNIYVDWTEFDLKNPSCMAAGGELVKIKGKYMCLKTSTILINIEEKQTMNSKGDQK